MLDPECLAAAQREDPAPRHQHVPAHRRDGADDAVALWITGGGDLRAGSGSTSVLWAVLSGWRVAGCCSSRSAPTPWTSSRGHRAARCRRAHQPRPRAPPRPRPRGRRAPARHRRLPGPGDGRPAAAVRLPAARLHRRRRHRLLHRHELGNVRHHDPHRRARRAGAGPAARRPFLAAALSGGIFGDHASPISDTTIIASMASATDHIDHVRTQLPYALIAAGIAT
jgi:tetracycline resistance efflux pump